MANYVKPQTRQLSSHSERKKLRDEAHNKNIVEVAQSLGMALERVGKDYQWKEHDSLKIDTRKNYFYWNSRGIGGDPIKLTQTMMECSFSEAVLFLTGQQISKFDQNSIPKREFSYFLKENKENIALKEFSKNERQLSEETIDFFIAQGVLAESSYKDHGMEKAEPVIVFKSLAPNGEVKGMALQGITSHPDLYPGRGKMKKTFGDGVYGCVVKVGHPPLNGTMTSEHPLTIIPFEAPFDMMAYYEFFKDQIGDALLVAMNGLKKSAISMVLANALGSSAEDERKIETLDGIEKFTDGLDSVKIILAVDNDEAGRNFIKNFGITKIPVVSHLPELASGEQKADWNELLQRIKKPQKTPFEERLKKAAETHSDFATRLRQIASAENMKHR